MRRNRMWIAGLAVVVTLTGCGDASEGVAGADPATESIPAQTQNETVPSTTAGLATATDAAPIVEFTTTTVSSPPQSPSPTTATSEDGPIDATVTTQGVSIESSTDPLDRVAVDGLLWMREEEKLARDVYRELSEVWDLPIFANITGSEQAHTDAVGDLLDRYGIPDPMADDVPGVFQDPAIQVLFDGFVRQGSQSLVDALIVGATIEDMDIVDLQRRTTGVAAIDDVYANLEKGSRNHLRAFIRTLERKGGEYSPTHLGVEEYEAIIGSPTERGHAGG